MNCTLCTRVKPFVSDECFPFFFGGGCGVGERGGVVHGSEREERGGGGQRAARREVYDDGKKVHMVSYGKGSASMREGRIRRWLQDMDKASE